MGPNTYRRGTRRNPEEINVALARYGARYAGAIPSVPSSLFGVVRFLISFIHAEDSQLEGRRINFAKSYKSKQQSPRNAPMAAKARRHIGALGSKKCGGDFLRTEFPLPRCPISHCGGKLIEAAAYELRENLGAKTLIALRHAEGHKS